MSRTTGSRRGTPDPAVLYEDLEREMQSTRRVLERCPEGKNDWRPHEKSRPLMELAVHLAGIPGGGVLILETDEFDAGAPRPAGGPSTPAEVLAQFDANVEKLRGALARADASALDRTWTFRMGERVVVQEPKRVLLRLMVLSHMVHHRAQLALYYRLLNVPVPGVYGPSADEAL